MKAILSVATLLLLFLVLPAPALAQSPVQDFDAGMDAYNRGDYAEAAKWYRKAAEQGVADAQYNLGMMYAKGEGVSEDDAEAGEWFRKAADQGNAKAQSNLGVMYEKGRGVPQDYSEAISWYRRAADQGHATAQYNLALLYDTGEGAPQDYVEATKLYRKSAGQGDTFAQHNLALMYEYGRGVPQDDVLAYMWFNIAGREIEKSRAFRDRTAQRMTPADITKAQTRARTCIESNYRNC